MKWTGRRSCQSSVPWSVLAACASPGITTATGDAGKESCHERHMPVGHCWLCSVESIFFPFFLKEVRVVNKVLIRCANRLSCTRRLSCTKRTIGLGEPESSEPQRSNGRLVVRIRRAFGSGEPSAAYSLYTVRSNLVGCGVHRMRTPVSPEDEYMDSKDRATKKRLSLIHI